MLSENIYWPQEIGLLDRNRWEYFPHINAVVDAEGNYYIRKNSIPEDILDRCDVIEFIGYQEEPGTPTIPHSIYRNLIKQYALSEVIRMDGAFKLILGEELGRERKAE